jgi:hypothetical protein
VTLAETVAVEADHPDALTVGLIQDDDVETLDEIKIVSDLPSIYEKIIANKRKASESIEMEEATSEERPDPGFRIYHVDSATRELTEVPPYTSPGEFFQMKAEGKLSASSKVNDDDDDDDDVNQIVSNVGEESQPLSDGYTAIREAYGEGSTEEATAESTRRARMSNRVKTSEIDESKIGAMVMPSRSSVLPLVSPSSHTHSDDRQSSKVVKPSGVITATADARLIDDGSDEKTYDGYQAIQQANSASSREEELRLMKKARMENRSKSKLS